MSIEHILEKKSTQSAQSTCTCTWSALWDDGHVALIAQLGLSIALQGLKLTKSLSRHLATKW